VTRHIILIGLSGAGKSVVGRELARLLDCAFRDLDEDIATRAGTSVSEIFRWRGEGTFRSLERDAMERALGAMPHVIAAGGGWAAQGGNLDRVAEVAFVVYLRCSPDTAATRLCGATDRPLLVQDPLTSLQAQLAVRRTHYERAHAVVETDELTAAEVATRVAALARSSGGW